jgi:polysaccharide chain length determinant protein (PEP-CTERM system associated)
MNIDEGLNLGDVSGAVERRWPIAAAVAIAVFLAAIVIAAILPDQYETYTTVLVEPQTISTQLVEAQMEGTELNQRLHLMSMQILSRPRLSRIIDDLRLYTDESKEKTREEVIELMRSRISVEPVLPELETVLAKEFDVARRDVQINTFRLIFRHDEPKAAAAVANRLANDFIEEHIRERVQVSTDTSEFIEAELARLAVQIQDVESRIAQVKDENPGRLPEDLEANQRLYERTIESLRMAERQAAEAESDEAFYRQQSTIEPEHGDNRWDPADPRRRVDTLELLLAEYLSKGFTEKHPDVIALKQQLDEVKKIQATEQTISESGEAISPSQQSAEAERRRAALRTSSARAEIERLQQQADQVQQRLAETPRVAERLTALERDYEHLFKSFQEYSNKRLEAAVAANAERRQKGEKLRILESAVPPPEPTSPNRLLIVVVGLLLGVTLGGGVGVLLEATDASFHGARQLQAALRIPVLAQIPAIIMESDKVAQRRRRVIVTAATAGIVTVTLLGAAAGYWAVNVREPEGGSALPVATPPAPAPAAPAPPAPGPLE